VQSTIRRLKSSKKEIDSILNELCADLSRPRLLNILAWLLNHLLVKMYNEGIFIRESEFKKVKDAAINAQRLKLPLVILPSHKSHADYLVRKQCVIVYLGTYIG